MKRHTNQLLFGALLLSLITYALISRFIASSTLLDWCSDALFFACHLIPAFCFQLLLCRTARRCPAVLPMGLSAAATVIGGVNCRTAVGWDAFGWNLFLTFSVPLTAGCALAWVLYGFGRHQRIKKEDVR